MNFRSRKMVKGEDLNGAGNLFGGRALAWIDEEAAIFAHCQLKTERLVTKAMSVINFKSPARQGDIIEIGCAVVRLGNSSITIRCTMRNKTTHHEIVTVEEMVFVNLDEHGKPAPHGITQATE
ncbi:acyl-CoA thioesterase [Azomonas macrocytogenes]|uniref:Acyl-CoA hydrolase n=1 Tax=Azomonas macrocytogenes TaxID=69962 RepID=A0A839T4F7_AZOMA|nr:hotdog domain-containing protein [Azomonas macrocytogenes]MBB3103376.1 acyl-CoA hydrolase [Azomonas macrocytogenes]